MKRVRLQVALLPWVRPDSLSSVNQRETPLKPWLHVCSEDISLAELAHQIVQKFAKIYVNLGPLVIQHLESDYGEILDLTDTVGDVFDDRAPNGESRTSIVRVACFPPEAVERRTASPFHFLVPESSARPKQWPSDNSPQGPYHESWNSQRSSVTLGRPAKRQRRYGSMTSCVEESDQGRFRNQDREAPFVHVSGSQQEQSVPARNLRSPTPSDPLHRVTLRQAVHGPPNRSAYIEPTSPNVRPFNVDHESSMARSDHHDDHIVVPDSAQKKEKYWKYQQSPRRSSRSHGSSAGTGKEDQNRFIEQPHLNEDSSNQSSSEPEPEELSHSAEHRSKESSHSADKIESDAHKQMLRAEAFADKAKAFAEQLAQKSATVGLSRLQSFMEEASEDSESTGSGTDNTQKSQEAKGTKDLEIEGQRASQQTNRIHEKRSESLVGKHAAEEYLAKQKIERERTSQPPAERTTNQLPRAITPELPAPIASQSSSQAVSSGLLHQRPDGGPQPGKQSIINTESLHSISDSSSVSETESDLDSAISSPLPSQISKAAKPSSPRLSLNKITSGDLRAPAATIEPVYTSIIGSGTLLSRQESVNDKHQAKNLLFESSRYPKFSQISSSVNSSPPQPMSIKAPERQDFIQAVNPEDSNEISDSDSVGSSDSGKKNWGKGLKGLHKLASMCPKKSFPKSEKGYIDI